jgi:hypothetical protein
MGVGQVLIVADLDRQRTGTPDPTIVRQSLIASGLDPVVRFGNYEVLDVPDLVGPRSAAASDVVLITGGPDAVRRVVESPLSDRLRVVTDDPGARALDDNASVLADSLLYRDEGFAQLRGGFTAVEYPGDPFPGEPHQRAEPRWAEQFTIRDRVANDGTLLLPTVRPGRQPGGQLVAVSLERAAAANEERLRRVFTLPDDGDWRLSGSYDGVPRPAGECGSGPTLDLDGQPLRTRSAGALQFESCAPIVLTAGEHRLADELGGDVRTVRLDAVGPLPATGAGRELGGYRSDGLSSELRVGTGADAVVTLPHAFNEGFRATIAGTELASIRLDGWQQGYLVPSGLSGTMEERFGPDRWQTWGIITSLFGGGALLLGLAATGRRRERTLMVLPEPRRSTDIGITAAILVAVWAVSGWIVLAALALRFGRSLRQTVPFVTVFVMVFGAAASTVALAVGADASIVNTAAALSFTAVCVGAMPASSRGDRASSGTPDTADGVVDNPST